MEKAACQNGLEEMEHFFDNLSADWDSHHMNNDEKISAIATAANIRPGAKIADIACGTGVMTAELLSRNPSKILGIDLSKKMIENAREKFADPRLELVASDLFDVKETGFDLAIIYNAYPHFPDKQKLVNHIFEMLNDGGRFMVAHGEGKEKINGRHSQGTVHRLSWPLRPVLEEAAEFSDLFHIDIMVDTPELYMLSGLKK
jgi:demethylmenaquinone methyltransferase/2-methoxy-6-polyprenyl-1,4-benzoquinol methylase